MAHSEKQQAQENDLANFALEDSVYTPAVQLADLVGMPHDSLPREELIRRVAQAALDEVTRLRRQADDTALELREISRQMLVAGGELPSLYQISHKLAHYSPPGVGREAGERLSYQAQRLDKGLRAIYEKLEKTSC